MSLGSRLRRLDERTDQRLKRHGLPGLYGNDQRATPRPGSARDGKRRLLLRVGSGVGALVTWPTYLLIVVLLGLGTVGYVRAVEGAGHSSVVPVVVLVVVAIPLGFVFHSYGSGPDDKR